MKKYFSVSFKYSDDVYCSNIAHAENENDVKKYYEKYEWYSIRECANYEIEEAQKKGKPVIEIETETTDETETETETTTEKLKKYFSELSTEELVSIHNEYCEATNNYDDRIYNMDEFDKINNGVEPSEIARSIFYGGYFYPCDDYFYFNGYGNICSCCNPVDVVIFVDDIIDYIIKDNESLNFCDIKNIMKV